MDFLPKMPKSFYCQTCNFKCSKNSNWEAHIMTAKHQNRTALNENPATEDPTFACKKCSRKYTAKSSLWYHEKRCTVDNATTTPDSSTPIDADMFMELLKQNQDFKTMLLNQHSKLLELSSQPTIVNTMNTQNTHNNQNNQNNHFNIQVFLNEKCKDAMNLSEFLDNIKVSREDLEYIGQFGYVNGMSNSIVKQIEATDIYKRPFHCTDLKREVIYVKNQDKWTKEGVGKERMLDVVNATYNKNRRNIALWAREDPNMPLDSSHPMYSHYIHVLKTSLGGYDEEEHNSLANKIIRNIASRILIDKDNQ